MNTHYIKQERSGFEEIVENASTYDISGFSREIKRGDLIVFMEYDKESDFYTGRYIKRQAGEKVASDESHIKINYPEVGFFERFLCSKGDLGFLSTMSLSKRTNLKLDLFLYKFHFNVCLSPKKVIEVHNLKLASDKEGELLISNMTRIKALRKGVVEWFVKQPNDNVDVGCW